VHIIKRRRREGIAQRRNGFEWQNYEENGDISGRRKTSASQRRAAMKAGTAVSAGVI